LKSFIHPLTKGLTRVTEYLVTFGAFGLFTLALLDSTFVPLPSSADALMLVLTMAHPSWMLLYAFMATAGSAIGCLILYLISRKAGTRALNRFSERKQKQVRDWLERYDAIAVLVATLLPPPFPFKLFVITAGVFRFSLVRFMLAIIAGRAFRFLLEGYFAVKYGAQAKEILAKYYPWIGLSLVVAILLFVLVKRWLRRHHAEAVEQSLEITSGN
jgi:membrane protein YqaA with SNARE-associated domain